MSLSFIFFLPIGSVNIEYFNHVQLWWNEKKNYRNRNQVPIYSNENVSFDISLIWTLNMQFNYKHMLESHYDEREKVKKLSFIIMS